MRIALVLAILTSVASGCAKSVWHRQEVVEWSAHFNSWPPDLRYCGSDAQWHIFLSHPMDNWVVIHVPRNEIKMAEELPLKKDGTGDPWYYYVDPLNGFQRVKNSP
jgi:hypothetical protein